jgi:rubrerythrin
LGIEATIMSDETNRLTTIPEILEEALRREKDAYRFYDSLLKDTRVGIVRDVIEQLRQEEQKHIRIIEEKITELSLDLI